VAVELWFGTMVKRRRQWLSAAILILTVTLVLSVSRGGWIAAFVGIAVICGMRRQWFLFFRISVLVVPACLIAWFWLPQDLRDYAFGFEVSRYNIQARYDSIDFAMGFFSQHPLLGVGVGLRKEYDATNLALATLAETGIAGLFAFSLVHVCILVMVWRGTQRVARDTAEYSLLILAAALILSRLAHGMVDHYWSRGPVTCAWAAVGMATLVLGTAAQGQRSNR